VVDTCKWLVVGAWLTTGVKLGFVGYSSFLPQLRAIRVKAKVNNSLTLLATNFELVKHRRRCVPKCSLQTFIACYEMYFDF
jgi:hypothetical protein